MSSEVASVGFASISNSSCSPDSNNCLKKRSTKLPLKQEQSNNNYLAETSEKPKIKKQLIADNGESSPPPLKPETSPVEDSNIPTNLPVVEDGEGSGARSMESVCSSPNAVTFQQIMSNFMAAAQANAFHQALFPSGPLFAAAAAGQQQPLPPSQPQHHFPANPPNLAPPQMNNGTGQGQPIFPQPPQNIPHPATALDHFNALLAANVGALPGAVPGTANHPQQPALPFGVYPPPEFRQCLLGPMNGGYFDPSLAGFHPYAMDTGRRKNATREVTAPLKQWLNDHRKNPYPTKAEKTLLAIMTKMSMTQVSTWFANARRRLKKENRMTWSPRHRTNGDDDDYDDDDNENESTDNRNNDSTLLGNSNHELGLLERPSSSASVYSSDEQQQQHPNPLNGPNHLRQFVQEIQPLNPAQNHQQQPKEEQKKKIWSIADTLDHPKEPARTSPESSCSSSDEFKEKTNEASNSSSSSLSPTRVSNGNNPQTIPGGNDFAAFAMTALNGLQPGMPFSPPLINSPLFQQLAAQQQKFVNPQLLQSQPANFLAMFFQQQHMQHLFAAHVQQMQQSGININNNGLRMPPHPALLSGQQHFPAPSEELTTPEQFGSQNGGNLRAEQKDNEDSPAKPKSLKRSSIGFNNDSPDAKKHFKLVKAEK